jgi:hypothetical protein
MSPLVEFLLARIAEDEDRVTSGAPGTATSYNGWHTVDCGVGLGYWANDRCVCRYVDRVLAECEAKRRIVELTQGAIYRLADLVADEWGGGGDTDADEDLLRLLALPYADHPDYREEWAP